MDSVTSLRPSSSVSSSKSTQNNDYTTCLTKKSGARFIPECAMKLHAKFTTAATAAVFYHRFFREVKEEDYDVFMVAAACLYLAGKTEDQPLKLRDVINVVYCSLQPDTVPPDIGEEYWSLRESLVQTELLVLRMLRFQLEVLHPHKYMLFYLQSLETWTGHEQFRAIPITRTAWAILKDFYVEDLVLDVKPQHLALACLHISFQCYGFVVPCSKEAAITWHEGLCASCTQQVLWDVTEQLLDMYERDSAVTV